MFGALRQRTTRVLGISATTLAGMGVLNFVSNSQVEMEASQEPERNQRQHLLRESLAPLIPQEKQIRERWERDEAEHWRFLPARAWPEYQPMVKDVPRLSQKLRKQGCICPSINASSTDTTDSMLKDSEECADVCFNLGVALLFNNLDCPMGLRIFQSLADHGHVQGMVATGIVLMEGLGVKERPDEGLQYLQKAAELGSSQADYELGIAYYNGVEGLVEEDEEQAYRLFKKAADKGHIAGKYMVADCKLNAVGTEQDISEAVPLMYSAAEEGHRYARQHIREFFDEIRDAKR